jgi:hypothetical protein
MMQVPLVHRRVRVDKHGSKFETHKVPAHIPNALLPEQNRPRGNTANQQGYKQRQRDQERQSQQDKKNIQRPLPVQILNRLGRKRTPQFRRFDRKIHKEEKLKQRLKFKNEENRSRTVLRQSSAFVRWKQFQQTPTFPLILYPDFHNWKPFNGNFN